MSFWLGFVLLGAGLFLGCRVGFNAGVGWALAEIEKAMKSTR